MKNKFLLKTVAALILITPAVSPIVENSNVTFAAVKKSKSLKVKDIKKPVRTVYLKMKHSDYLYKTMKKAMNAWNDTGVFTFKQVKRQRDANIVVTDVGTKGIPMPGAEFIKDDVLKIGRKASKLNPVIYLNPSFLNKSYVQKQLKENGLPESAASAAFSRWSLAICEHELGHAIGLKHYKGTQNSVMKVNPSVPIQKIDVQNVRRLYHLAK